VEPEPEPEPSPPRPPLASPSLDANAARRLIRPAEVDMRAPEAQIRAELCAALQGTLTPMLALRNHGCEALCAEMAARARD
jgi:hypothetical protein